MNPKEFCFEAHVHLLADDTAHACEQIATYMQQAARVYRGEAPISALDNGTWKPTSTLSIRPNNAGDMN